MKRVIFVFMAFLLVLTSLQPNLPTALAQIPVTPPPETPTDNPQEAQPQTPTDQPAAQDTGSAQIPTAADDVPTALVGSGVTSYTLSAPKVFWHTGVPICPPASAGDASGASTASPAAPEVQYAETIMRIAALGSPTRTLYSQLQNCSTGQILSGLAADLNYVYFFNPTGLMRLSTLANVTDAPQIMNALVDAPGELVDGGDRVFYISNNTGGSSTKIGFVWKSNNQRVDLITPGSQAHNLSFDGEYFYYMLGSTLYRYDIAAYSLTTVTTGVSGYYAEGKRLLFCTIDPFQCYYSSTVYIAKGRYIYRYSNNDSTLNPTPIYTSVDATASIYALVTDFSKLFFFERRTSTCDLFCSYIYVLQRTPRSGGAADPLHTYGPTLFPGPANLKTSDSFLFWHEEAKVMRLANDASAMPVVNVKITGMEVTQGIQNLNNTVLLIKDRRTFVRLYVKSDAGSVAGVTAHLYAPSLGLGPLQPVNKTGTKITVRFNPLRSDIEQSFLFELPKSWLQGTGLSLRADLNPYKVPLESNYGDNALSKSVTLVNSPTLSVEFFRLNYTIGGVTYSPRIQEDVMRTYSWIMRAYPLGGTVGGKFKPRLWDVDGGTKLGMYVNRTHPACTLIYNDPDDDVGLCASYFTNTWLWSYRVNTMMGWLNVGLSPTAFYYGMISDASNNFPRGQARYNFTSVGPSGTPGQFFSLGQGWDTDGTYADWYAAHEIGHSLGRAHPNAGSDNPATSNVFENCQHSRSDPSYPYGNTTSAAAPIGPADNSMEGFDVGDAAYAIGRAVLPSNTWNDVMSYCTNQWISDYTYTAMYNFMLSHPSSPAAAQINTQPQAGDWLAVSGVIDPIIPEAAFGLLQRLDNVINTPVINPGQYRLRLLDVSMGQLSSQDFSSELLGDDQVESFALVVPFAAGTRFVEVSKVRDGVVLALQPVSANPPVVSNVALQGAPNPVSGIVTLGWNASDPDNDLLSFDILYSVDNGASFKPIAAGIESKTTLIDTALLGGSGTARLRVIASDGVHTAYADSAAFTMGSKPPEPYILNPESGLIVQYGQLVNFSGMALDAQDGTVADFGLQWTNAGGDVLGEGPDYASDELPVGENLIRLQATNSKGLWAAAEVTVYVLDDLTLPGPTLTVSPSKAGWQINSGVTTLQTADIAVNNSGGGSLTWTAADDAPWLSLSSAGDTISDGDPQIITLTANPTGLADGTTHTAYVTIIKPASGSDPEQTVIVLVTLSIGDIWSGPPAFAPATNFIYLPIAKR